MYKTRWSNIAFATAAGIALSARIAFAGDVKDFRTEFERSNGAQVGDATQAELLYQELRDSTAVHGEVLGRTIEGRPIIAFEVGSKKQPPILLIGGIHAGEVEGCIALLQFIRDVASGRLQADAHTWIVPYSSPDGSADMWHLNRPNQNGPEVTGFRINASGLNLNRDFVKVQSEEVRALLKLVFEIQPALVADFHTTDGGVFDLDVGLQFARSPWAASEGERSLQNIRDQLSNSLIKKLRTSGVKAENYYPDAVNVENPELGLIDENPRLAFSDTYFAATGRIGVLIEVNAYLPLINRVQVASQVLRTLLTQARSKGLEWATASTNTQKDLTQDLPGALDVPIDWKQGKPTGKRSLTVVGFNPAELIGDERTRDRVRGS